MERPSQEQAWGVLTEEVVTGMRDWRVAHPQATFAEIEAAVEERLGGLRARLLAEAALADPTVGGEAGARPVCAQCGQRLVARGERERTLQVVGPQTVRLRRAYLVCSACGAGVFPPG